MREYSLILEVQNPMKLTKLDRRVSGIVDSFLVDNGTYSINTVVNTIFPAFLYQKFGGDEVLEKYLKIGSAISSHDDCQWGTYAMRMIGIRKDKYGKPYSPLETLVAKMKRQVESQAAKRAAYEISPIDPMLDLPLYEGDKDHKYTMGGPCLSHLSFKIKPGRKLMLVAVYRSHYYVQRALGNLYGLAWLQQFVAERAGLEPAELVCHSTMAILDTDKWTKAALTGMLKDCGKVYQEQEIEREGAP